VRRLRERDNKFIETNAIARQETSMCARYTLRSPADLLVIRFGLPHTPDLKARFNIAPSQSIPAIGAKGGTRPPLLDESLLL
jgi:hypothetical protein